MAEHNINDQDFDNQSVSTLIGGTEFNKPTTTTHENDSKQKNTTHTQPPPSIQAESTVNLPRVAIRFCTKCKWNLRAAHYAQELLQTFDNTLGEISLIPVSGGIFDVTIYHLNSINSINSQDTPSEQGEEQQQQQQQQQKVQSTLLWDRKSEGRFPDPKELKSRVRNVVDPARDLGHIDRSLRKNELSNVVAVHDDNKDNNNKNTNVASTVAEPVKPEPRVGQESEQKTEVPVASGGESLMFGSNIQPNVGLDVGSGSGSGTGTGSANALEKADNNRADGGRGLSSETKGEQTEGDGKVDCEHCE